MIFYQKSFAQGLFTHPIVTEWQRYTGAAEEYLHWCPAREELVLKNKGGSCP